MTDRTYLSLPGVRWSRLKHMLTSAAHYQHACEMPEGEESAARRMGRAIHCALLEAEAFRDRWVVWDQLTEKGDRVSPRSPNNRKWVAFQAECARLGQEIVTEEERSRALACARAIRRHPTSKLYLSSGDAVREMALTWQDEATGIQCKLRLDLLARGRLVDVKSTERLDPRDFARTFAAFKYHAQFAFYLDGLAACGHELDPEPIVFAVETKPPWDVVPYVVPASVVRVGRDLYRGLLERIVECEKTGVYPGRCPTGLQTLELPAYAMPDIDMDMED